MSGFEKFHAQRFTQKHRDFYSGAHKYARETLARDIFSRNLGIPKATEPKFYSSAFYKFCDKRGYAIDILKGTQTSGTTKDDPQDIWISMIIGEFNMTLRNLSGEELRAMSDMKKWKEFYSRFRNYLVNQKERVPTEPPMETTYMIRIQRR
jgi:hypothetical protein